jgi:VIT1/CCC1 family predicted Fe2+/Mn2+ transporter
VFLLVTLATLPVVLPFAFIHEVGPALRVSNGIALAMLYVAGSSFGKASGLPPRRVGFVIMVLGLVLVGITMALGG